jgi:hypothetical protein
MSARERVELLIPTPNRLERIELLEPRYSDYARRCGLAPMAGGASFSDYLENKVLDHIFNDPSYTAPSPYLRLWTSALTDASDASTSGEAAYTGYAALAIATSDMSAAASGSKTNSATLTFAACTGGSSTITYWGVFDGTGTTSATKLLVWGTCTSTVISTTQTPPTIAAGGLAVNLD